MKTKIKCIAAMITITLLIVNPIIGAPEECYNFKDPKACPQDQAAQVHGGCTAFSTPSGSLENVDSENPNCRSVEGSYCEGYNTTGYCGSTCGTSEDPTDLRADVTEQNPDGTEQNQVPATHYAADFYCTDYDVYYAGVPSPTHVTCGPICLNGQSTGQVTITVTDCKTTTQGCPDNG